MPNANDVSLVRTFVRPQEGTIEQETIKSNQTFEVVVEVEAGQTIFNNGGPYQILGVVKDENTGEIIKTPSVSGNFGDNTWPRTQAVIILAPTIPPQGSAKNNHIYRATAVLVVGTRDPNVEFTEDVPFVITAP